MTLSFLSSEIENSAFDGSRVAVVPIPFEATTSYIKGTKDGPNAILTASDQLESFEPECQVDFTTIPIHTLPSLPLSNENIDTDHLLIEAAIKKLLRQPKFIVCLGGEHSISAPIVRSFQNYLDIPFGVIHFDAHFDLRDTYEGKKASHACALRRIRESTDQTLSIGIRSFSKEEADYAKTNNVPVITDQQLIHHQIDIATKMFLLPDYVYITIDLDFFSPAEIPGVGTPVPGGPLWWDGLNAIRTIFEQKKVLGVDIVELCPTAEKTRSSYAAALLAQKCISYYWYYNFQKNET